MPGLGTSFGRGGATTAQTDLANADAILIMGSSMAENHPVGFQWVMEARERGAKIIHVDPRFNRTSSIADIWVPLRAGTDIIFLGGLINYILQNDKYFHEYVQHYTNAAMIVSDDFRDTEDLGGVFSGWDEQKKKYDPRVLAAPRDRKTRTKLNLLAAPSLGIRRQPAGTAKTAVAKLPRCRNMRKIPRCRTRTASSRFCAGTSRATRPSWWNSMPAFRRSCS